MPLLWLRQVAVVACDREREQHIVHLHARRHVVNDERRTRRRELVGHKADVRQPDRQLPDNDVTGMVIIGLPSGRNRSAMPSEEHVQVRDTAMVDIGVGGLQAPLCRVRVSRQALRMSLCNCSCRSIPIWR